MKKGKYDLNFYEALEVVMNGGAVRGDDFADGIFLKLNILGQLATVDAGNFYMEETNVFLKGMVGQMFRRVNVWTMKELSY